MSEEKKFIDVKKIFADKNPRLVSLIPGFVFSWIRKLIHEDDINAFIHEHGNKKGFAFNDAILERFGAKIISGGEEHIPEKGGFIIAANHPLGGLDALALLKVISQKRKDLKFIVNDILLRLENLSELFAGVNKHGKNPQQTVAELDALYASGQGILIFPSGLVSRMQNGIIKDLEWKKSFISKAKKYKLPVIPVHIEGRNTMRFYRLANLRKNLGVKANIEMFLLPDEMFRQKNKEVKITIGKAIYPEEFTMERTDYGWAEWLKTQVYKL